MLHWTNTCEMPYLLAYRRLKDYELWDLSSINISSIAVMTPRNHIKNVGQGKWLSLTIYSNPTILIRGTCLVTADLLKHVHLDELIAGLATIECPHFQLVFSRFGEGDGGCGGSIFHFGEFRFGGNVSRSTPYDIRHG